MKPAHWSKVAKSLAGKYNLKWADAVKAYKALKSESSRKPSLRMVSQLPAKIPKTLKGVKAKPAIKAVKSETPLPSNIQLAPKAVKPFAALVRAKQGARNKFEEALRSENLPVSAIARNDTGRLIASQWRNFEGRGKLTKLLKQGYKQVDRDGAMKKQTIERIADLLENQFGVLKQNPMWNDILKNLYGQSTKGK